MPDGVDEGRHQLGRAEFLALEVLRSQVVVGLGNSLDELLPEGVEVGSQRFGRLADSAVGKVCAAGNDIDDALEVALRAYGKMNRDAGLPEAFTDGGDGGLEVRILAVHLVDHDEHGFRGGFGPAPQHVGPDLRPGGRIDEDEGAVGNPQRADNLADEVQVSGWVQEVDLVVGPLDGAEPRGLRSFRGAVPPVRSRMPQCRPRPGPGG